VDRHIGAPPALGVERQKFREDLDRAVNQEATPRAWGVQARTGRHRHLGVIDFDQIASDSLPIEIAVSAFTMAELAAGPHASSDPSERARRQDRLQRAEATFDPLLFDAESARASTLPSSLAVDWRSKGARHAAVDLLIAATALASGLPVYTRNGEDLQGLGERLEVVEICAMS
jgi:predicted nucleic acid-binding protein